MIIAIILSLCVLFGAMGIVIGGGWGSFLIIVSVLLGAEGIAALRRR